MEEKTSINLNIVECKFIMQERRKSMADGINLNIVECK